MTMPKTAIDEDGRPVLRQEYIWGAGVSAVVFAESEAPTVKSGAYKYFEFSVLPAHAGHKGGTRFGDYLAQSIFSINHSHLRGHCGNQALHPCLDIIVYRSKPPLCFSCQ